RGPGAIDRAPGRRQCGRVDQRFARHWSDVARHHCHPAGDQGGWWPASGPGGDLMPDDSTFGAVSAPAISPLSAQADRLMQNAGSPSSDNRKIEKSAKDFESILLG